MAVEPNISSGNGLGLELYGIDEALEQMDLGFMLVGHSAFRNTPKHIVKFVN